MSYPWVCPKCGAVFGPSAKECIYCNKDKVIKPTVTYSGLSPQDNARLYGQGIKGPVRQESIENEIFLEDDHEKQTD